jgi:hypothetical protein
MLDLTVDFELIANLSQFLLSWLALFFYEPKIRNIGRSRNGLELQTITDIKVED